jgi:GNAT superfamily N-acetyltransferase
MEYMLERAGRPDALLRMIRVDDRVAGYMFLELSDDPATAFLWYFAIDERLRGRGVGAQAMKDTLQKVRRAYPSVRYLFFEVHTPSDAGHNSSLDRRRIEFYRRLGAYWVRGTDYRIPAADDPERSLSYDPMFFSLDGQVDPTEVRQAIALMARDNFEDRPDDPRWQRLLIFERLSIVGPTEHID